MSTTAVLEGGVLKVTASALPTQSHVNQVVVRQQGGRVTVTATRQNDNFTDLILEEFEFPANDVEGIVLLGGPSTGRDHLWNLTGIDSTLRGGAGLDVLVGGLGANVFDGGLGIDFYWDQGTGQLWSD